jgi:hypothetical protein
MQRGLSMLGRVDVGMFDVSWVWMELFVVPRPRAFGNGCEKRQENVPQRARISLGYLIRQPELLEVYCSGRM